MQDSFLVNSIDYTRQFDYALFVDSIKPYFIVVSLLLLFHIIYLIYKLNKLHGRFQIYKDAFFRKTPPPYKGEFVKRWENVQRRMETMQEAEYKLAIIEADKIFDDLLKKMSCKGNTTNDRLRCINKDMLPSIDKVKRSHKIRNKIAHDPDFHISYSDAKNVIESYKDALKELKILA